MRKIIVPGVLIVLLGVLWGWEYVALRQTDTDWDRLSSRTRTSAEKAGAEEFHGRQNRLRALLEGLASRPAMRQALRGGVEDRRAAFRLLTEAAAEGAGLELRGPDGGIIAWGGMGGPAPNLLVRAALDGLASSSVVKSRIGTQLVVGTPVRADDGPSGALVGRIPISTSFAFSNRFIQSSSLADEVSARAGTRVEFQFDDPLHDEGMVLTGVDGTMIGFVVAGPPDMGATVEDIRGDIAAVRTISRRRGVR